MGQHHHLSPHGPASPHGLGSPHVTTWATISTPVNCADPMFIAGPCALLWYVMTVHRARMHNRHMCPQVHSGPLCLMHLDRHIAKREIPHLQQRAAHVVDKKRRNDRKTRAIERSKTRPAGVMSTESCQETVRYRDHTDLGAYLSPTRHPSMSLREHRSV